MIIGILLAAAVAGSAPAEAGATQAPAAPAPVQVQAAATDASRDMDKMVCKHITPTGTRLGGEKICKTRREWLDIQRQSREALDSNITRGLQENPQGG